MAATMLTMAAATTAVSPIPTVSFGRTQEGTRASIRGRPAMWVCRAAPMKGSSGPAIDSTGDKVADKIEAAQEACAGDEGSEDCATAWDEVKSAQQEKATGKGAADPLEEFCEDNPEADECRVYKD